MIKWFVIYSALLCTTWMGAHLFDLPLWACVAIMLSPVLLYLGLVISYAAIICMIYGWGIAKHWVILWAKALWEGSL